MSNHYESEEAIIRGYRRPTTPPPAAPRNVECRADMTSILDAITEAVRAAGEPLPGFYEDAAPEAAAS